MAVVVEYENTTIIVLLRATMLNSTTSGCKYFLECEPNDARGSRTRDVTRLIQVALAVFATSNIAPATIAHRHPTSDILSGRKRMHSLS